MTPTNRWLAAGVAMGLLAFAGVAEAQGQSQGRGRSTGGSTNPETTVSATVVFRSGDAAIFRDYFTTHKITAEPLPPGIAKNLARGKALPPGIAKKVVPSGLVALGPKLDRDTTLSIYGDVVVAMKGGVVIDIMGGVFKR